MNNTYLEENIKALNELKVLDNVYKQILNEVIECLNRGNKLIFVGNGGSAADSSHIVSEFVAHFKLDRKSLPAISLTDNNALLTSISNDYSFNDIFKKQLESLGNEGDILFGITTSGKSKNVLRTLPLAKEKGIKTVFVTGKNIKRDVDYLVNIPSNETSIIQNLYMVFFHMLCLDIDEYYNEHRN